MAVVKGLLNNSITEKGYFHIPNQMTIIGIFRSSNFISGESGNFLKLIRILWRDSGLDLHSKKLVV